MSDETPQTKQVHVYVPYADLGGSHVTGDVLDLPYETEVQRADVASLLSYGIVGTEPKSDSA